MSDIVTELRERALRAEQEGDPIALLEDAADEIARLREEKAADWKAACDSALAGTIEVGRLKAEIATLRLTDAERKVLRCAAATCRGVGHAVRAWPENQWADTIDAFLERHANGGDRPQSAVVQLPATPDDCDPSEGYYYERAIRGVQKALDSAGVKWEMESP